MKESTTDPSQALKIFSRIGMYNEKTFEFIKVDGTDYDYSVVSTFQVGIKNKKDDVSDFLTLSEGSGLTRFSTNKLHLAMTEAQSAKFKERTYYLELRRIIDSKKKVWLSSNNIWHTGVFDGVNEDETILTINEDSEIIQLVINESQPLTLKTAAYSTELTFDTDKEIYQDVSTPIFTLAASGNINGVGIILRLNTPTSVTFPANFEAHANSATLDATKLNVYTLVYFSNWNGSGTARVIYMNSLFTAI